MVKVHFAFNIKTLGPISLLVNNFSDFNETMSFLLIHLMNDNISLILVPVPITKELF